MTVTYWILACGICYILGVATHAAATAWWDKERELAMDAVHTKLDNLYAIIKNKLP